MNGPRYPSIRTIENACGNDRSRAPAVRRCFDARTHAEVAALPGASEYARRCYREPGTETLRMIAIDRALENHGTESMQTRGGEWAEFSNAGDMYVPTVIFWRGRYRVQSVGDFVETMERHGIKFR